METKYNGWTNYATWKVNLEIFDGVAWLDEMHDESKTISEYANSLKDYAIELIEMESKGLALDYALAFLDEVNFYEIAKSMINAYEEES